MSSVPISRSRSRSRVVLLGAALLLATGCGEDTAPIEPPPTVFTPRPDVYYRMRTLQSSEENRCLESNVVAPGSTLGGPSFLDRCQDVTGQDWIFVPLPGGVYRLETMFRAPFGECFESNEVAPGAPLDGAAYMRECHDDPGQLWWIVPAEEGAFQLRSVRGGSERCLDGNRTGASSPARGGVYMAKCANDPRQIWIAVIS